MLRLSNTERGLFWHIVRHPTRPSVRTFHRLRIILVNWCTDGVSIVTAEGPSKPLHSQLVCRTIRRLWRTVHQIRSRPVPCSVMCCHSLTCLGPTCHTHPHTRKQPAPSLLSPSLSHFSPTPSNRKRREKEREEERRRRSKRTPYCWNLARGPCRQPPGRHQSWRRSPSPRSSSSSSMEAFPRPISHLKPLQAELLLLEVVHGMVSMSPRSIFIFPTCHSHSHRALCPTMATSTIIGVELQTHHA